MKRLSIILICLVLFLASCYEIVETYVINPDGSGKVIIETTYMPYSSVKKEMEGKLEGKLSEEELQMNIYELLKNNVKGVEVWSDVTFNATEGGKIYFKGTAYFKDINKIKRR